MFTSLSKIKKPKGATPEPLEESVAQAIYDLQVHSDKLKAPLRELHITAAKEVDVGGGKQCIVIFVPVPMLPQFQKVCIALPCVPPSGLSEVAVYRAPNDGPIHVLVPRVPVLWRRQMFPVSHLFSLLFLRARAWIDH